MKKSRNLFLSLMLCYSVCSGLFAAPMPKSHPALVINQQDVAQMRIAIQQDGAFKKAYMAQKNRVDQLLIAKDAMQVPKPVDGGGGASHEQHKRNYQLMYDAAVLYQISQQPIYAEFVANMLKKYAVMYPTLDFHPKKKKNSGGRLFWQSLNEAVWLLYSIQAYDLVFNALTVDDRNLIEQNVFRPMADFLSNQSPKEFNKIHNHGTWSTAAVGMTGYVLNEPLLVQQALLGLDLSGEGGFLRQLDELFSPQGYYSEGPYYQRYAVLPFITFAKAIEQHEPQRKIFNYRDGVIVKAIEVAVDLTYQGRFFPINDAIKEKSINTAELVQGVAIAYSITQNPALLDVAIKQNSPLLTGDGLRVQQGIEQQLATPFVFGHKVFGDGMDGKKGALVVMRNPSVFSHAADQALVFKATTQGMGHGHFDKLHWQFYDQGAEIISDYGAARFVNVEAKQGGGYLTVNQSWAKQTVAHNTLVVDQASHFNGDPKLAELHQPNLHFFAANDDMAISQASIDSAYDDVKFSRTLVLLAEDMQRQQSVVIDLVDVSATKRHQYDLPVHYLGQFIDTNAPLQTATTQLTPLGEHNGYQHLWLTGHARLADNKGLSRVTWLNDNGHFYSHYSIPVEDEQRLFTRLGANDPLMDLRPESAFIQRVNNKQDHQFINVLVRHGLYNPTDETTQGADAQLVDIQTGIDNQIRWISLHYQNGLQQLVAFSQTAQSATAKQQFSHLNQSYSFVGQMALFTSTVR